MKAGAPAWRIREEGRDEGGWGEEERGQERGRKGKEEEIAECSEWRGER